MYLQHLLFSEDELIDLEILIESLKEKNFEKDNTESLEGKNIIIPTNN